MAKSNRERLTAAFEYLVEGLQDPVDEVMQTVPELQDGTNTPWNEVWARRMAQKTGRSSYSMELDDPQTLLKAITEYGYNFKDVLSRPQQSYASELREVRDNWAHGKTLSSDDTIRALDTIERLLRAVDASDSADDVARERQTLQRQVFQEQTRSDTRTRAVSVEPSAGMKPWREVILPHDDVLNGNFTAAEFAADLHKVHTHGTDAAEYADPVEFFNRTYLTEGLTDLLSRALKRFGGDDNASPVVNLQTNFGGGKTHSMLALYHLFSGLPARAYPQDVQELVAENGNVDLEGLGLRRVVLVGTYLHPGSVDTKPDGTQVHTLWGELAWQLGGREAYEIVAEADRTGTNPGESLHRLLREYSPSLILIDEWVAYARQLVDATGLHAGSFETQFTFAQTLTEAVRTTPRTMLLVSIPASEEAADGEARDNEVGGARGKAALQNLQNVIGRVADQWRPSTKEESFEIVRRRVFRDPDADQLRQISATARLFAEMYRKDSPLFPSEAATASNDYETRIKRSYPIHPDLMDRLYEDWSALERFQRTRGVLKLVSTIVSTLWATNDTSPMIMPGTVPVGSNAVGTELTQYLEDSWKPIIDADIDGEGSTAAVVDKQKPVLGARSVTQRIARTIFMGAAPRTSRKGLDKQYVWLGVAVPGDQLGNFGSALEQLSQRSTFFYEENGHYWFDTQPSVAKTAADYAERLREDPDTVWNEVVTRLQRTAKPDNHFQRIHAAPTASGDVPDQDTVALVIVHPKYPYSRSGKVNPARAWVHDTIEQRGSTPRVFRNTLVFAAADSAELESLDAAVRNFLAWDSVVKDADALNLSAQQTRQASENRRRFNESVDDKIISAYSHLLYPEMDDATQPFTIEHDKMGSGTGTIPERAVAQLIRGGQLVADLGAETLGMTLRDQLRAIWGERGEITVGELWGYFARFPYMMRLARREVLDSAIAGATQRIMVDSEKFAIAARKDPDSGRYLDMVIPPAGTGSFNVTDSTVLLSIELAQQQVVEPEPAAPMPSPGPQVDAPITPTPPAPPAPPVPVNTRYRGAVPVDGESYASGFYTIGNEILAMLNASDASVSVTVEIHADLPAGFPDSTIRVIKENAAQLGFKFSEFS